ncbi:hypothetical protein ACOSQ4_020870 [Xanthoceras sorbifolium]
MASSSSFDSQQTQDDRSSNTHGMDFSSLAKTLHFNLPIKLDEDNFIYWKTQILPAINALDLEDFIDSTKTPPSQFINVQVCDENGETHIEQQPNKEYQKWKKSDQILLFWLISTLSQKVVGQVTKCKSAREAWMKLENLYSQKSLAKIMQLRQHLQTIKKGARSVSDFILQIKNVGDALSAAGEEISERDLLLCLMNGVGHEYDAVVVLISSQRSTMSLEEAQFLLLMHEQRIEQLNSASQVSIGGASANFASNNHGGNRDQRGGPNYNRNGPRGRGRGGRNGGRKLYCQLCTKPGHQAFQCYHRFDQHFTRPVPSNNSSNNSSQAFVASAYLATPGSVGDPSWYVDSGATNHITSDLNNLNLKSEDYSKNKLNFHTSKCLFIGVHNILPLYASSTRHSMGLNKLPPISCCSYTSSLACLQEGSKTF